MSIFCIILISIDKKYKYSYFDASKVLYEQEKKINENPSVGIILCTDRDKEVVKYSMSRSMSPTMVSKYTLKLPDKKLLENKLAEMKELFDSNKLP